MTKSFDIRIRPDLTSGICRLFPRIGNYKGGLSIPWTTTRTRTRFALRYSWSVRPDLGTRVVPSFPDVDDEGWQEHLKQQAERWETVVVG